MSPVRADPNIKLRLDKVVRRVLCPDCDVEAGSPCRVTGANDEPGRKPGQYRTISHLGRWKRVESDPVLSSELDQIRLSGLQTLWEQITGRTLTGPRMERFRSHPA